VVFDPNLQLNLGRLLRLLPRPHDRFNPHSGKLGRIVK
jgi:hypothetical protein